VRKIFAGYCARPKTIGRPGLLSQPQSAQIRSPKLTLIANPANHFRAAEFLATWRTVFGAEIDESQST
jgi:hypothetical protein